MRDFFRNQTGSTISFISVAIVLVIFVSGGIYFVSNRAEKARNEEASKIANQPPESVAKDNAVPVNEDSSGSVDANSNVNTSSSLPETGIEMDLINIFAIGIITASFLYFINSRRNLKLSL